MIQVCSRCATRWNVRDRQRQWCPRCHGALLPPYAPAQWTTPVQVRRSPPPQARSRATPAGYRWIAVRPGAGPPPRRRRRGLGPTPRYSYIPRWGLIDPATQVGAPQARPQRRGPSLRSVRAVLATTLVALGAAAVLHLARYVLLIVNRDVLLNSVVAGIATWVAVAASAAAILSSVGFAFTLTEWLIARRSAAYAHHELPEPRRAWALRLGCLLPVWNIFWAVTFVVELAVVEGKYRGQRRLIWSWWVLFVLSTAVSVFATATSRPHTSQGIADNTVSFVVAYVIAMGAAIAVGRVLFAFERAPVQRPSHRWTVVADDSGSEPRSESPAAVEREGREPAAIAL